MELHFSPGAYYCGENKNKDPNSLGYRSQMSEKQAKEKEEERKAKEEKDKKEGMKTVTTFPTLDKVVEQKLAKGEIDRLAPNKDGMKPRERHGSSPCELELRKQIVRANAMKAFETQCPDMDQEEADGQKAADVNASGSFGFLPSSRSVPAQDVVDNKVVSFAGSSLMADIPEKPEERVSVQVLS